MIQNPKLREIIDGSLNNFKKEHLSENWRSFGSARLRMDSGKFLISLLQVIKPDYTMEFGSGASTQTLAAHAKKTHFAYEHVPKYWRQTVAALARNPWFNESIVYLRALNDDYMYPILPGDLPQGIQLVLIDGPPLRAPKNGKDRDRYRTLHSIMEYLSDDAIVLLDNTERESEQGILEVWKEELGIEYETHEEVRGLGIIDPWGHSV